MIERRNKIYNWNELHFIVVVKYKHPSISEGSPTWGMKKYIILFVKEARTSNLRMSTHKVGEHFKKCV